MTLLYTNETLQPIDYDYRCIIVRNNTYLGRKLRVPILYPLWELDFLKRKVGVEKTPTGLIVLHSPQDTLQKASFEALVRQIPRVIPRGTIWMENISPFTNVKLGEQYKILRTHMKSLNVHLEA